MAILQTAKADILQLHTRETGDSLRHPFAVRAALDDLQILMFALPFRLKT